MNNINVVVVSGGIFFCKNIIKVVMYLKIAGNLKKSSSSECVRCVYCYVYHIFLKSRILLFYRVFLYNDHLP